MALSADVPPVRFGVTGNSTQQISKPIAASVTVYGGSVATTRAGYITPASSPASTDVVWGLIYRQTPLVPPQAASSVAGTYNAVIDTGSFFLNAGTGADAMSAANVGATVYLINETTVGLTNGGGTRPVAGVLLNIDTNVTPSYAVALGSNRGTGAPS